MDQETLYTRYLEELTDTVSDPDHFDLGKTYAILKELCVLLRVCKGVMIYYAGEEAERNDRGTVHVCYNSGEEAEEVLSSRTILNGSMIAVSNAYRAKSAAPWTETERKRILLIERLMISTVGRMRLAGMLEQASLYDDAGYSNIRYFHSIVDRLASSGALNRFAALRFNLRHFALINQQLGREASDRVMKRYINAMQNAAGEDGVISRLGGDNFVAVCPKDRLDDMLAVINGVPIQYAEADKGRVMISATAGIFEIPEDYYYQDFGNIMDRIINAFTAAKTGGNGNIIFSSNRMLEEKEKVMKIRQMFPLSLRNGTMLVYYQPKINIEDNTLVGAEALSRWRYNNRLLMPSDFIPVLEQSLDICQLDFYVLDRVCRDMRRWLDEGRNAVRISVNMSRRHLIDMDLLDRILSIIDKYNVPHRYIEIELTETTTEVGFAELKRIVSGLQAAGICTSVDDFGTGYSSLELIREIPWDILKVDKSFLPLGGDGMKDRQNIMFRHLVNMAREIGLTYVAEGVETGDQVNVLRQTGCNIAQGFFYDEALPVEEFEKRLEPGFYKNENCY